MVKGKLKAFLVAILVAHFDGAVSQDTCEQGNLAEVYRLSVLDVDSHVLTAIDMSSYGEPKIRANSENADNYTEILRYTTSLQVILKDIQKFEETTASNKNAPSLRLELVDFVPTCPIQKVDIRITIIDTNNNDPLFTDEDGYPKHIFEVEVPMSLPKNIELQNFGAKIYAKDVDLTNTRVTFSIEPEDGGVNDLDIQYGNVVDDLNKVHSAILKSTAAINYKERTYRLTVEDEGTKDEGKRTATGKLTVKRNEQESVVMPKFEKSFYTANFKDDLLEELIVVVQDGTGDLPKIVEEGMKTYFQVSAGRTPAEFYVKSIKKWNKNENAIFTLQINGPNIPPPIETVIIGKMYQENRPRTTYFEHPLYTGNFENHFAKLEVNVINGIGLMPVIEGDKDITEYFEVFFDPFFVERLIVQSIKNWDKNIDAVFTLKINDWNLASPVGTVVIIKQENFDQPEPPRFEKSHYIGTYKNGQLSIPHINLLCVQKCDVKFEDAEMDKIFSLINEDGSVTIEQVGLIQEDLEEILLIVVAEEDGLMGSTAVLVKIIKDGLSCEGRNKNNFIFAENRGVIENLNVEL